MNKKEVAAELNISTRLVERYAGDVRTLRYMLWSDGFVMNGCNCHDEDFIGV